MFSQRSMCKAEMSLCAFRSHMLGKKMLFTSGIFKCPWLLQQETCSQHCFCYCFSQSPGFASTPSAELIDATANSACFNSTCFQTRCFNSTCIQARSSPHLTSAVAIDFPSCLDPGRLQCSGAHRRLTFSVHLSPYINVLCACCFLRVFAYSCVSCICLPFVWVDNICFYLVGWFSSSPLTCVVVILLQFWKPSDNTSLESRK